MIPALPVLDEIRLASQRGRTRWRARAQQHMMEKKIWREDVAQIIRTGKIVENQEAKQTSAPYFIHGRLGGDDFHVVLLWDPHEKNISILAISQPSLSKTPRRSKEV
ncbi:MAG: DUF4258 domain-containing protein [Deltaproteobacteria bacterium]|nr:DUF4258 domain-containing protein [Deltaproteobacteria bacterium]